MHRTLTSTDVNQKKIEMQTKNRSLSSAGYVAIQTVGQFSQLICLASVALLGDIVRREKSGCKTRALLSGGGDRAYVKHWHNSKCIH